jgi:hypothetical protein
MRPFVMERWQSHYENVVRWNLSESGVHPLTLAELLELADEDDTILATGLGYGQSNGTPALRERIAALYPGATADHVVVTNGSAEANFIAAWQLLEPGSVTAVLTPTYMQLPGLAPAFGGEVRAIPLEEERGWQPDPDRLAREVAGAALVVVTNPQNPTGARLTGETVRLVLEAAEAAGAWVLADEVYRGAEREGPETDTLWGRYERVIATGSLSKAYGLPGLRIGWLVAPAEHTEELWARKDYTTISPGALTDGLAALALRDDVRAGLIDRARSIIRTNYELVREWVDTLDAFQLDDHEAGAVCFPSYDLPVESMALAEQLRTEKDVLIVPGAHFDLGRYLRIGFGIERAELEAALARVAELVRTL